MVTSLDPGTYRVRVLGKVSKKLPYLKDLRESIADYQLTIRSEGRPQRSSEGRKSSNFRRPHFL